MSWSGSTTSTRRPGSTRAARRRSGALLRAPLLRADPGRAPVLLPCALRSGGRARRRPDLSAPDPRRARPPSRRPSPPERRIVIPGYAGLRDLSAAREPMVKAACGGAWRSYVQHSHWRILVPVSREHQHRTVGELLKAVEEHGAPLVHLLRFPSLAINHGMVVFEGARTRDRRGVPRLRPERPGAPGPPHVRPARRTFSLPANRYWRGGDAERLRDLPALVPVAGRGRGYRSRPCPLPLALALAAVIVPYRRRHGPATSSPACRPTPAPSPPASAAGAAGPTSSSVRAGRGSTAPARTARGAARTPGRRRPRARCSRRSRTSRRSRRPSTARCRRTGCRARPGAAT